MPTNYPNALDTTAEQPNNKVNNSTTLNAHAPHHNNISDALIAIETELGTNPRGSFADVKTRLNNLLYKSPSSAQTVQPTGDFIAIALRQHASQNAAPLLEFRSAANAVMGTWNRQGILDMQAYQRDGSALASTHLADSSSLARNPSPSFTSPTVSSPSMTGTTASTTPPVDNNSTRIATTAYVKNQGYVTLNNPVLTGTPTAPTPPQNDNSTRIATTAFVVDYILSKNVTAAPVGTITPFAGSTIPSGWLLCDGSAVSRTTYSALFDVIGTAYGAGDGSTTFNLPDLRGRGVVGLGSHADVDARGDSEGVAVGNRRPAHSHTFSISTNTESHSHTGSTSSSGNHTHTGTGTANQSGIGAGAGSGPVVVASVTTSTAGSHTHGGSITSDGQHTHSVSGSIGVSGMTNMPAYLTINYIIKT